MTRLILTCLVLLSIFHWSCEKDPPTYTLIKPTESDRKVLVEEFSGALCPNCPQGTQDLENLKAIYAENLIIVTIHAGDFASPYPDSRYDFSTEEGDQLLSILGNPIGYPSAVVNRVKQGQSFQSFASKWASLVADELDKPAKVNISLVQTYDPETRILDLKATILPLEEIVDGIRLSVLIKEDGIIDPQADRASPTGKVIDYVHKYVMRVMLSSPSGDLLTNYAEAFLPYEQSYQFTLPAEDGWWRADKCHLVVYASVDTEGSYEILQAHEEPLAQ
ncbi:MAG: Omp28-related outer membrane protein [Saprospiraceae bacterium]|nr:Omp28-related outer membrane protein [Saprospiraceae bacterium]